MWTLYRTLNVHPLFLGKFYLLTDTFTENLPSKTLHFCLVAHDVEQGLFENFAVQQTRLAL